MNELLRTMKQDFAENTTIQSLVGDRCKFLVSLQNIKAFPIIVYNAKELARLTKDGFREYDLTIFIMANDVETLLNIYEAAKTVMATETPNFYNQFVSSSYPELVEDRDDVYIIDINYAIQQP